MIKHELARNPIDFGSAYRAANQAQREAIDQTEGALLVVAGPGTGKTQIIAARIAHIISQGNGPEAVLCLTYTDAGTIAMRDRLLRFIGPDAYRVRIFTFHAFCNLVIQENPSYFGYGDLQPASELEKIDVIKAVLDSLPLENPLARERGDLYSDSRKLLGLYATIKREDWDLEEKTRTLQAHIDLLPTDPAMRYKRKTTRDGISYNPGDPMQHKIDAETRKFQQTIAALLSYPLYQQALSAAGRYDFDDMIIWVIRAFRTHPGLLLDYQERFQYVLVDEYQDTSTSQNEIVDLLMEYWEDPNLFVVGDDDQSIYRFQGASVANMLGFSARYRPTVVALSHNYRSSRQILDAAGALISNNFQRLANRELFPDITIDKTLIATKPGGSLPEVRIYPNAVQESLAIAQELEQRYRNGSDMSKIAVLYREHRQADLLISYLSAAGVPFSTRRRHNILDEPLIIQLITILKYLDAESRQPHSSEGVLFRILHAPYFKLEPLEIARLYAGRKQGETIRTLLGREPLCANISRLIESALGRIDSVTVQELVQSVISGFGILHCTADTGHTLWRLELLNTFFDFVKEESSKKPRLSLEQLVNIIESMESQQIKLPAQRIALNSAGVNLITAHSSKGLEFETVYLMGCAASFWEAKRERVDFSFPSNMTTSGRDDDEELRRLFYVAMTRAERELFISCSARDNNDRELAKSRFVAELETSGTVRSISCSMEDHELVRTMEIGLSTAAEEPLHVFESDFVGELLVDYRLSLSHLNQYLECPKAFFYSHILHIPTPKSPAAAFGTAAHDSLEYLFISMKSAPGQAFPSRELFLEFFSRQMLRHADAFTDIEFKRRLESGSNALGRLYDENIGRWSRDVLIEQPFEALIDGGIRLNGRIDKVEVLNGNRVNLVDYKTGVFDRDKFRRPNPAKVEEAMNNSKEPMLEDVYGGSYWRQAVFYKLLLESSPGVSFMVSSTEFCFVEPDPASGRMINQLIEVTPDDVDFLRGVVATVYHKILGREFSQGCSRAYCPWCRA